MRIFNVCTCQIVLAGDNSRMTKEAVHKSLHTEPFKPFSLRLTDGSLLPVRHPDFMALSQGGRTAVVFGNGEDFSIVDISLVTALESPSPNGD